MIQYLNLIEHILENGHVKTKISGNPIYYSKLKLGFHRFTWKKISIGCSMNYYSFMENIDKVFYDIDVPFRLPTGIKKYREANNDGTLVLDGRIRVDVTQHFTIALISSNLTNLSYSLRPLKIESPRTIRFQLSAKF